MHTHEHVQYICVCIRPLIRMVFVFTPLDAHSFMSSHSQVMCIDGEEVFHMTTTLYNQATRGSRRYADMSNVDTRVILDVSSIKFVFLYRFIGQLLVSL